MKKIKFLNITFKNFNEKKIKDIIKKNGLFVFPSGPELSNLRIKSTLHDSLINSDHVFFDSGLFVLLLNIFKNSNISKFSGYKFLKIFLNFLKKKNKKVFLVNPNLQLSKSYKKYMSSLNIKCNTYIAPNYNKEKIVDKKLVKLIKKANAKIIIINLGGGVQEVLGYFLKKNFDNKVTIICTGAAMAFLTKDQAPINTFFDKFYMGWLLRILFKPNIYLPRYFKAIKFIIIFFTNEIIFLKS